MRIEFGDLKIDEEVKRHFDDILRTNWVSGGPKVKELEDRWGDLFGYAHNIAVSNGTDADTAACMVLYDFGAKRGDEIIVPALAFASVGNSVLAAGFKPVFVDIKRETLNINPDRIEEKITPRTRAIMAVHTMGKPCEMDKIMEIAKNNNLKVIEDSCEAHGAKYKNKYIGHFGDISAFSFYVAHVVSCGDGGMVSTNSKEIADIVESLKTHGRKTGEIYFNHVRHASNFRMNALTASVGIPEVKKFWEIFNKRKDNLYYLLEKTRDLQKYAWFNSEEEHEVVSPHAFSVTLKNPKYNMKELYKFLEDNSVKCKRNFGSMPTQHKAFEFLGHRFGEFPEAEYVGDNGLHFGIHQYLSRDDLDYISGLLHEYFTRFNNENNGFNKMRNIPTKEELMDFEKKIENMYKEGKILAPVHLSGGNEEQLIEIFREVSEEDWVFSSYRSHYQALLKGIPKEWLEKEIVEGRSMFIMSDKYKFYSSSIVPGHLPIAIGVALALKMKGSKDRVWAFCGDMAAETGVFYECVKFAEGHKLPITFIVEDDGLSVYTPTKNVWKSSAFSQNDKSIKRYELPAKFNPAEENNSPHIRRYSYERIWPHHGIGIWVEFPDEAKKSVIDEEYIDKVKKSMNLLSRNEKVVFIGQTVCYKGSPIFETLEGIPMEKRMELPIMEEVQMGISTGLALEGFIPVSIYPRWDFLILASNQLVNHLDKMRELSNNRFNPKVIIRTMVGSKTPLYPGPQHIQDHTEAFRKILTNIDVVKLERKEDIIPAYEKALNSNRSTLIVEPVELLHT